MYHASPPLAQRVYSSKSSDYPDLRMSSVRPLTYKPWSPQQMSRAYSAVINEGLSVRRSAVEYNVPRSTLGDRVSGNILEGAKSGKKGYLSEKRKSWYSFWSIVLPLVIHVAA